MSKRMFRSTAIVALVFVVGLSGCRAGGGAQPGIFSGQPGVGRQLGQRAGNIAINRVINAGITRAIGAFYRASQIVNLSNIFRISNGFCEKCLRLAMIPLSVSLSSRIAEMAAFRRVAVFSGMSPVLAVLASSAKTTSRTQWSRFSIPQCPRL